MVTKRLLENPKSVKKGGKTMGLILCPECGTKISDRALTCPHCGYSSENRMLPISVQDQFEIVPRFEYEIEEWDPNRNDLTGISYEDNRQLFSYFGKWKNIKNSLPAIAEVIESLAANETYLVADYDKYVAELIEKGIYRFSVDNKGEILPTIRDAKHIVKQVRLKEVSLNPQITQALNNLATHAVLAQILDEIEYVEDAIKGIHIELQDDRIALAESAWDKLMQARKIQDSRLREIAILSVIGTATDAKRTLMRNFMRNNERIKSISDKSTIEMALSFGKTKNAPQQAGDALQDLISLTNAVQVECEGYAMIGEYDACKETLMQFRRFVLDNKLNERDTLLRLNSGLEYKQIKIVNKFEEIADRITRFNPSLQLESNNLRFIESGEVDNG